MTDDDKPIKKGRGHPPQEYKYPKGMSGNPWGRPLGSKNKKRQPGGLTPSQKIALEEAHHVVGTGDGKMEAIRAVNRAQIATAAKGGTNAQRNAIEHIEGIEAKLAADHRAAMLKCEEYKQQYEALKRAGSHLVSAYDAIVPHPDDVEVNFDTGIVNIHGPANARERKLWGQSLGALAKMREMVFQIRREVARDPKNPALTLELLHWTNRFMRHNEALPERHRLNRLPIWRAGQNLPMPDLRDQARRRKLSRLEQVASRRSV